MRYKNFIKLFVVVVVVVFFFFKETNTQTHTRERETREGKRSSNIKAHHTSTQKPW